MGPLKDIKILEFSGIGPGPYCGMLLADMGADVIRVAKKGTEGLENKFDIHNRSKRSITADLKNKNTVNEILKLTDKNLINLNSNELRMLSTNFCNGGDEIYEIKNLED